VAPVPRVERVGALDVLKGAIRRFVDDGCSTQAAAVAFSAFFAIFPLLLALIALVSPVVQSKVVREQILGSALTYLPGSAKLVETTTAGVIEQRGSVGLVATLLLLVSGIGVFQAVVYALNVAFDAPRARGTVLTLLLAAGMMIGVGGLMLISLAVTAAAQAATVAGLVPIDGRVLAVAQTATTMLIDFVTFAVLYKIAPNVPLTWREVTPGAAVAAVLFEVAKWGFVLYVTNVTNYAAVYGAIGAVIALLTWCYVSALILLLGAEVSSEYSKLRWAAIHRVEPGRPPPTIRVRGAPSGLQRSVALLAVSVVAVSAVAFTRATRRR
jgi:membrane protein